MIETLETASSIGMVSDHCSTNIVRYRNIRTRYISHICIWIKRLLKAWPGSIIWTWEASPAPHRARQIVLCHNKPGFQARVRLPQCPPPPADFADFNISRGRFWEGLRDSTYRAWLNASRHTPLKFSQEKLRPQKILTEVIFSIFMAQIDQLEAITIAFGVL